VNCSCSAIPTAIPTPPAPTPSVTAPTPSLPAPPSVTAPTVDVSGFSICKRFITLCLSKNSLKIVI